MLEVTEAPANREHFSNVIAFASDVIAVCDRVGISPIMDGSLAVFVYTRNPAMEIHDLDLNCPELDFPKLQQELLARDIQCEIRSWHVLQARREGLKVEFGAIEYWMHGIPINDEPVRIAGFEFRIVSVDGLREQYRRGLVNTAEHGVDRDLPKHQAIREKLRLLDDIHARP